MPDITPLSDAEIQAMRERCEKATPGPWEWFGIGTKSMIDMNLRSTARGYHIVMDFVRSAWRRQLAGGNGGCGSAEGRDTKRPLEDATLAVMSLALPLGSFKVQE